MVSEALRRPQRGEGPLLEIARYWQRNPEVEAVLPRWPGLWIGLGEPFCGACGWLVPDNGHPSPRSWFGAGRWLDRAHIVTRAESERGCGLDLPPNLIQLCHVCHKAMPRWDLGDEMRAFEWIGNVPRKSPEWQYFTDTFEWPAGRVDLLILYNAFRATGAIGRRRAV